MQKHLKATAFVFIGGALGSAARYAIGLSFDQMWILFAVNILGTMLLGFTNGKKRADWVSDFVGSGFAGGFTTLSGLSLVVALSSVTELTNALAYLFAMLGAGFAAYLIGLRLAVSAK